MGFPPFEGKYPEINPHLTLANHIDMETFEKLKVEIKNDLGSRSPIEAVAKEAWLMETDETGYWRLVNKFDFFIP